jgi:hypothetical protein
LAGRKGGEFLDLRLGSGRIILTSVKEMELEVVDWIYLAQDKAHWPVMFALLKFLVQQEAGSFSCFARPSTVGSKKHPVAWN